MKHTSKSATKKLPVFTRALPWILVICGIIGLICAFIIMYEKLQLFNNASYQPSCDLNPVISCGSVMKSAQSHVFGFPNPIIGLVCFPILITVGMALFAKATFKRWFWLGLQAGTIFGLGFVHWLFFQSVYRVQALCPYCIAVWTVTITSFWYVLLYNLQEKAITLPGQKGQVFIDFLRRHHLDILVLWLLIIAGLILKHFWYYYGRNF